jgi:hypothetical protein
VDLDRLASGRFVQRGDYTYYIDVWYSYEIDGTNYAGSARLGYETEAARDERLNAILSSGTVTVWYHPLLRFINFGWKMGPVVNIILLVVASLFSIGVISSVGSILSLRAKKARYAR